MNTIKSLENQLSVLRQQLSVCTDPDEKAELDERIDFIQDDIDEIEDANREQDEYEEMTGTRPQDLYYEQNNHALRQSEMIDTFNNEY